MDTTKLNVDLLHDDKYSVFNQLSRKKIKKRKIGYNFLNLNPTNTHV